MFSHLLKGGQNTKKTPNTPSLFNENNTTTLVESMNTYIEKKSKDYIENSHTLIIHIQSETLSELIKINNLFTSIHKRVTHILERAHIDKTHKHPPLFYTEHIRESTHSIRRG